MNFFNSIVQPSFNLLGKKFRTRGLLLLPLLLVQSLLDVLSVASFAPMALLILRPESLRANDLLLNIYNTFGFENEKSFAVAWVLAVAVFFVVKHIVGVLITALRSRYAFGVSAFLSEKMLDQFINRTYGEYQNLQSSTEQVKVAHLPVSFANNILLSLATLFAEGLILAIMLVSLLFYDWHSVIFVAIAILPAVIYYRIINKRLSAINHSLKNNYPDLIHHLFRLFENFVEINLYQKREYFLNKIRTPSNELHRSHILQAILQANSFRLFETTAALGFCFLVLYALLAPISPDTTVMLLGLYTAAGFRAVPSFNRIFVAFLQIKTNEHVVGGLTKIQSQTRIVSQTPIDFNSVVEFKNLSFAFPEKPVIIDNFNFSIAKGQRIAVTGPSGSGKTTFLLLIMRFLKESQGKIVVDGVPLEDHNISQWRNYLGYVPQHAMIQDGSVIENVAFGVDPQKVDKEKITSLLRLLDMGPWFDQLPEGLMTQLGEHGIKLSGGQRQRITIARALYSEANLLLFDEATSQVDSVTEQEVHEALKSEPHRGKTLIMVTHRQPSLQFFDKIYNLNMGRILEVKRESSQV